MHEFQYYCAKGYGVVPVIRVVRWMGEAFMQANIKDWGMGPFIRCTQSARMLPGEGWIDTSKLVVTEDLMR